MAKLYIADVAQRVTELSAVVERNAEDTNAKFSQILSLIQGQQSSPAPVAASPVVQAPAPVAKAKAPAKSKIDRGHENMSLTASVVVWDSNGVTIKAERAATEGEKAAIARASVNARALHDALVYQTDFQRISKTTPYKGCQEYYRLSGGGGYFKKVA
jgi:hypothetical protein